MKKKLLILAHTFENCVFDLPIDDNVSGDVLFLSKKTIFSEQEKTKIKYFVKIDQDLQTTLFDCVMKYKSFYENIIIWNIEKYDLIIPDNFIFTSILIREYKKDNIFIPEKLDINCIVLPKEILENSDSFHFQNNIINNIEFDKFSMVYHLFYNIFSNKISSIFKEKKDVAFSLF